MTFNDSASSETKNRRKHVLVNFAARTLEEGELMMTKNVLNRHTWVLEVGGFLVTDKVLNLQIHICKVLRKRVFF